MLKMIRCVGSLFAFLSILIVAHAEDRLVILSPHWEGIKTEFGSAFQDWYLQQTGHSVELEWRDMGGASDDLRFILSEYQQTPSSIGIDLFFGGGIDPYLELKERGLLHSYKPPQSIMAGIPSEIEGLPIYDPQGDWFGAALSSFGILRNDRVIQQMELPEIKSWRNLMNPKLKGWVESGDPRNSGSTHMIYEAILQAYGWDEGWKVILGMSSNIRQFDRSASSTAKACAVGNVAYALVVDFYGFTQIAEVGAKNMSFVIPSKESVLTPDSIAILKGAPHLEVAKKFVEFVLSDAGQSLWLVPRGHPMGPKKFSIERMAIRPKLYDQFASIRLVKTNPFTDFHPLHYNSKLGALRWSALNALLGAMVIDRDPSKRASVRIPVTEEDLNQIAKKDWKNLIQRNRIQLSWQRDM